MPMGRGDLAGSGWISSSGGSSASRCPSMMLAGAGGSWLPGGRRGPGRYLVPRGSSLPLLLGPLMLPHTVKTGSVSMSEERPARRPRAAWDQKEAEERTVCGNKGCLLTGQLSQLRGGDREPGHGASSEMEPFCV